MRLPSRVEATIGGPAVNRPLSIACLAVLVLVAACGRQGASTASTDDPLPDRYRGNLLESTAPVARPGSITATYLGTSALLIDDGGTQLLFDPVLSRPAAPTVAKPRTDT